MCSSDLNGHCTKGAVEQLIVTVTLCVGLSIEGPYILSVLWEVELIIEIPV